jgi:hypothetical protein
LLQTERHGQIAQIWQIDAENDHDHESLWSDRPSLLVGTGSTSAISEITVMPFDTRKKCRDEIRI